jgi:hypothetical protein
MAAAAAVAAGVASVAGCSSTHSVGVFYGSPGIIDSGNQDECEGGAEAGVEAGPEGGSVVAFYGAASFDGGTGLTDAPEQG